MNPVAEIRTLARQLTLSHLAQRQFDFLSEPVSNEQFLLDCLRDEVAYREQKAQERRIKQAQIPTFKDFDSFDTNFQQGITPWQLQQLKNLTWIEGVYNLILIGPPGTGKTHIALAIGNKVLQQGYKVFFSSLDALIHVLKTAEISRNSQASINWIKEADLLIIDELGYLPIGKVEANLFFQLISQLYENTSVIITSNKSFDGWAEFLGDPVLATALLDRLTHKCLVLSFADNSYRLAHRKEIFVNLDTSTN